MVGAVYFAHQVDHGRSVTAIQLGLLTAVGMSVIALLLAVADLRVRQAHPEPERAAATVPRGFEEGDTEEVIRRG